MVRRGGGGGVVRGSIRGGGGCEPISEVIVKTQKVGGPVGEWRGGRGSGRI